MAEITAEPKQPIKVRIVRNPYTGRNVVHYVDQYGRTRQAALKNR